MLVGQSRRRPSLFLLPCNASIFAVTHEESRPAANRSIATRFFATATRLKLDVVVSSGPPAQTCSFDPPASRHRTKPDDHPGHLHDGREGSRCLSLWQMGYRHLTKDELAILSACAFFLSRSPASGWAGKSARRSERDDRDEEDWIARHERAALGCRYWYCSSD